MTVGPSSPIFGEHAGHLVVGVRQRRGDDDEIGGASGVSHVDAGLRRRPPMRAASASQPMRPGEGAGDRAADVPEAEHADAHQRLSQRG